MLSITTLPRSDSSDTESPPRRTPRYAGAGEPTATAPPSALGVQPNATAAAKQTSARDAEDGRCSRDGPGEDELIAAHHHSWKSRGPRRARRANDYRGIGAAIRVDATHAHLRGIASRPLDPADDRRARAIELHIDTAGRVSLIHADRVAEGHARVRRKGDEHARRVARRGEPGDRHLAIARRHRRTVHRTRLDLPPVRMHRRWLRPLAIHVSHDGNVAHLGGGAVAVDEHGA